MESSELKRLRIFVASPSDVVNERTRLAAVIDDLESLAKHAGVTLELLEWGRVTPNMGRPEQVILDQLKPNTWDIFIGILWHRFGTPTGGNDERTGKNYLSGTQEEFSIAYSLWKNYKRPRVMFYRCMRHIPPDQIDPEQYKLILDFMSGFSPGSEYPGLYQKFDSIKSFERLVRKNIMDILIEYSEQRTFHEFEPREVHISMSGTRDNLPPRIDLLGREKEVQWIMERLNPKTRSWLIGIVGLGGIGKTAVSLEAAYLCKSQGIFDKIVYAVVKKEMILSEGVKTRIQGITNLEELFTQIAITTDRGDLLGLPSEDKRRALLNSLSETRSLIIFDNVELLSNEENVLLGYFLEFLPPGCKAIVISRQNIGYSGIQLLILGPIDWQTAQLMIERYSKKMKITLNSNQAKLLYESTGGVPLALRWALGLIGTGVSTDYVSDTLRKGIEQVSQLVIKGKKE